ncbi:copper resistance CopC family protein [Burkholderia ubonensis]|uniref:Copper resistance protein n=1 Tax=Burkholderia ubonensis subsp. mesacidophila TaxID=265293 RepID=A0A2A4FCB9_9BURK|nr:copper resistance protein CopC [Burkholderia ubonensis]PCE30775.1 copper resistance protein [Burkholderia ubonensis subsp. mesacidophila]
MMRTFNRLHFGARAAAVATGILIVSTALAHVFPQKQSPSAGAEVAAPPRVTIVFDGPLEPAFSSLNVSNSTGKQVNTAKAQVDPNDRKSIDLALPPLPPDTYTVHWVAVAADGHRTHGDYSFKVK